MYVCVSQMCVCVCVCVYSPLSNALMCVQRRINMLTEIKYKKIKRKKPRRMQTRQEIAICISVYLFVA